MGDEVSDGELDLIFTSPPYFTQSDSIVERWWPEGVELIDENITEKNVDLAYQNYLDEMTEILSILHSKLREGRYMILNVSDIQAYGTRKVYDVPSDLSYIIRNELNPQYDSDSRFQYDATITWDKGKDQTNDRATTFFGSGRPLTYHPNWRCERLLVFRKGSTETPDDEFALETQEFQRFSDDFWQISNATIESDHSEGFTTELAMTIIQLYSYPGDTVADPFGGYGITPFAVKTLNEQKYPSDIDWKGLAWENFSSESTGDMDFRERTAQLLTGNLSLFRDEYFTA
jgi:DNA modification methylase